MLLSSFSHARLLILIFGIVLILSFIGEGSARPFRMFQIWFENKNFDDVVENSYWKKIITKGTLLDNYNAITSPSQPNYVASIAGSTLGCDDDDDWSTNSRSLIDLFEAKGVSWKAYLEDYPGGCSEESHVDDYYRKHNPFISFKRITKNKSWCNKLVNADQLQDDIDNNDLPEWSFYVPNIKNDGHDTDLQYSGRYLDKFFEDKLSDPHFIKNTLVIVTFDETHSDKEERVATILLGPLVKSGDTDSTHYNHYSLVKTAEDNWNLGNLGRNDKEARAFSLKGRRATRKTTTRK